MRLRRLKLVGSRMNWQSEFLLLSTSSKIISDLVALQTSENSGNILSLISAYAKHSVSIWLKRPKRRSTIFWLFCNWSLKSIILLNWIILGRSMHYSSKWSSIQCCKILKMSFIEKYLKLRSNLANCAISNISQDFSVMNVF